MSQKLVQSQSMQQVQTLSPQQVLQVRLLEMPVSELEQRVKNELIDNGALEESLGSPEDADTSSEDVYDGTDAESAGSETSGLDGGLPSGRCAGLSVAGTGRERPSGNDGLWRHDIFLRADDGADERM